MSKLFAKSFLWTKGADEEMKELLRKTAIENPARVRYLTKTKEFHFYWFDIFTWLKTHEVDMTSFKIHESSINRFFKLDQMLADATMEETDYRIIRSIETEGLEDFYDDEYFGICFIQLYYYLSKGILKDIKRQAHVWKLGREKSPWFTLTLIPINKHGGRPVGGGGFGNCYLNREEQQRLLENLERYDAIVNKYAQSEVSLDKFIFMHKELSKLGNKLPEFLQKPFMKREAGLTWYWHALRYAYKKANGLELNPTAEEIKKQQRIYGFPFQE